MNADSEGLQARQMIAQGKAEAFQAAIQSAQAAGYSDWLAEEAALDHIATRIAQNSASWWVGVENPRTCPLNSPGLISAQLNPKKRTNRKSKPAALREDAPPYHVNRNGAHNELRFIDLFCGIGGFRLAFEKADCKCVFSSDWNEKAQETHAANFGEKPHGDIHTIAVADIPQHDILCAGFSCQPFSIAGVSKKLSLGKKHGFEDKEQGNLFFSLAEIIEVHQPAAFVLENVKNLRSHDQGRTFQVIHDTLTKALGYTVYYQVIDTRSVVPQHRERIFIVGFKERRGFEFPEFPAEGPKLETILEDNVPEKYTLTDHLWN